SSRLVISSLVTLDIFKSRCSGIVKFLKAVLQLQELPEAQLTSDHWVTLHRSDNRALVPQSPEEPCFPIHASTSYILHHVFWRLRRVVSCGLASKHLRSS